MNRGHDHRRERRLDELAALLRYLEALAEERLSRSSAEADERVRTHERDFRFEPRATRANLRRVWLRVYAALTSRFPFEVLYYIGDVHQIAIDASLFQRAIEQLYERSFRK